MEQKLFTELRSLYTTSKENPQAIRIRIRMRGLLIEISAVNGRFTLEFIQKYASPIYVNAFLKELEENGIVYDLQDVNELELPNIKLPWTE